MSYFPNVFPTVCYSDTFPRGKQFDSPAEFARADDGKWVDTPALLPFAEEESDEEILAAFKPYVDAAMVEEGEEPTALANSSSLATPDEVREFLGDPDALTPEQAREQRKLDAESMTRKQLVERFRLGNIPNVTRKSREELIALAKAAVDKEEI